MAESTNDGVQGMLNSLQPDHRLTSDREGWNPLDKAIAVSGGVITETELYKLLDHSGLKNEDFESLSPNLREVVSTGISKLWKINRFGLLIEQEDKSKIGTIQELAETQQERERAKNFAAGGWLEVSVKNMVELAKMDSQTQEERSAKGTKVYDAVDAYVKYLTRSGYQYDDDAKRRLIGDQLEQTMHYLRQRDENVHEVSTLYHSVSNQEMDFLVHRTDLPQTKTP